MVRMGSRHQQVLNILELHKPSLEDALEFWQSAGPASVEDLAES